MHDLGPYGFEETGFAQRAVRQLDADFAAGAIAVKIYKVMGMEMKSKAGKYVMPDDPAFEPIYKDIAAHHRTVVAHIAEPDSCWQPPNPSSPDYDYYKEHPEEYAYAHPEWPSKAAILAARDHLVEENPKLRVVGAHLGSMEADVDQMAQRFDRYPNFAVDTAARIPYFMLQPREKVRAFLIKYQDRILYGTDLGGTPDGGHRKDRTKLGRTPTGETGSSFPRTGRSSTSGTTSGSLPACAGSAQDLSRQRRPLAAGDRMTPLHFLSASARTWHGHPPHTGKMPVPQRETQLPNWDKAVRKRKR